ncbi:dihydrofolate reductase family protein [Terriglobus sp. TAA 43]|uniref:dihydrofolate reductase family protein n=1 Tax=Terriglobus sp. TAA 43 TaxID=278961 RepID=UPI000AC74A66|nr:dihydrofolate reductase family protein [Terriglobus sp. TAA 43]
MIYGRRMYEVMRYWDDDQPGWEPHEREYAAAWRSKPKWVVSRSLTSVGPNATLISGDVETAIRKLKAELTGDIEVAGPELAQSLTDLGLIDAYQIYLHPVVVGGDKPFFSKPQPSPRLEAIDRIVPNVVRLTYVPD